MNSSDGGNVDGPSLLRESGVCVVGELHRARIERVSLREDKPSFLPRLQERGGGGVRREGGEEGAEEGGKERAEDMIR